MMKPTFTVDSLVELERLSLALADERILYAITIDETNNKIKYGFSIVGQKLDKETIDRVVKRYDGQKVTKL